MALIDPNKSTSVFDGIIHEPHSNALEPNPTFFYADEGKGTKPACLCSVGAHLGAINAAFVLFPIKHLLAQKLFRGKTRKLKDGKNLQLKKGVLFASGR